ncbi:hypothetical protein [Tenacibaculum maritimum]|uniref:hypothetical protein n=1 Tax=Tenacibaculum maritimum TaxID=107401 RepID=UPI0012E44802|nr:hypothetical protein [Tenacibaculum maritimum]MCD9564206.1 hypothetical protein [Tenacibaculum maritimum]MCD9565558.1 hypothetical protein [Tenacibaculum maritimum]MCD9579181.1 hypothetical protein [Tenacibaculum maritimum]MCD9596095.1 hypothetical protein [Tenacibaculum maritimum]MCD9613344.1 hypothetical protein [Tenacibaculum maritimum]
MKIILSQVLILLMYISSPSTQKEATTEKNKIKESITEEKVTEKKESEGKIIEEHAFFDGYNEYGYSFSYTEKEENIDKESESLTFEEVPEKILAKYNLTLKIYKGKVFKVKYLVEESEDETEGGKKITVASIKLIDIQLIEDDE